MTDSRFSIIWRVGQALALSLLLVQPVRAAAALNEADRADSVRRRGIIMSVYDYFKGANKDKTTEKAFDFSLIGGPHFNSDTKLGIGIVASGLYRIDKTDLTLSPSNVSIYGDVTTTGFYLIGIKNNAIFPHGNYRMDGDLYFFSFPSSYWGLGYENGDNRMATEYKRKEVQFKTDILRRIFPGTYLGGVVSYRYVNGKKFKDPSYLDGERGRISSFGVGVLFEYDTRDFIPNPYCGTLVKAEQMFYPSFFGNSREFKRTEAIVSHYERLWKGMILAAEIQAVFNYGDTPWSMVAMLGGTSRMRGYYEGQYRDNDMIQTQVEFRQRVYGRNGIVVWGGLGNVFPDVDHFHWSQTLHSYGIGYRWEFKNRVNVRLDYGIAKGQTGFYFGINEAF